MNAREVLAGLRAAEQGCYPRWHDGQALCPLCKDDGSCALAAAIQWFEEHVGAEAARRTAEHCDHRLCKQWGDAEGNCNCPCTPCRDADSEGRHRTLAEHA